MAKKFVVLTPNRNYSGVVQEVKIVDGVGVTEDKGAAYSLERNYHYVVIQAAALIALADSLRPKPEAEPEAETEPDPESQSDEAPSRRRRR